MGAKTRRVEARVDPADDEAITAAAQATGMSVSAFIVGAARREADRINGRADVTLMDADLFDALIGALEEPDELPELAAIAARPRAYRRG